MKQPWFCVKIIFVLFLKIAEQEAEPTCELVENLNADADTEQIEGEAEIIGSENVENEENSPAENENCVEGVDEMGTEDIDKIDNTDLEESNKTENNVTENEELDKAEEVLDTQNDEVDSNKVEKEGGNVEEAELA